MGIVIFWDLSYNGNVISIVDRVTGTANATFAYAQNWQNC